MILEQNNSKIQIRILRSETSAVFIGNTLKKGESEWRREKERERRLDWLCLRRSLQELASKESWIWKFDSLLISQIRIGCIKFWDSTDIPTQSFGLTFLYKGKKKRRRWFDFIAAIWKYLLLFTTLFNDPISFFSPTILLFAYS